MKKNLLFSLWLTILTLFSTSVFGQNTTVIYDFSASGAQDGSTEINLDSNIKFKSEKNSGTSVPVISSNELRLYQNSNKGGSIVLTPLNNATIKAVKVYITSTAAGRGPNKYIIDNNADVSLGTPPSTNIYEISNINATSKFEFYNVGSSSTTRTYIKKIEIIYELPQTNTPPTVNDKTITGTYGVLLTDGNITATGNVESWLNPTGNIPTGITFDNGVFSGTPTQAGTYVAFVKAENEHGESDEATVTFEIAKAEQSINPELSALIGNVTETSASLPTVTDQGQPITYTSSSPSIVSVNNNVLSYNAIGNATITASAAGTTDLVEFSTAFNVKVIDPSLVYNGKGIFEKIDNISQITNGYYVIVGYSSTSGNVNVMPNNFTGSYSNASEITLNNSVIYNPTLDLVWNIQENNGKYNVSNNEDEFLDLSTSTNINLSTSAVLLTLQNFDAENDYIKITKDGTTRSLGINTATTPYRFAGYNTSLTGQRPTNLYKLNSTIWNGTAWSHGVPTSSVHAIVSGNLEIASDLSAKSITVEATGSVTVKSGNTLKVENALTNNATADKFVVESEANLVQVNADAINVGTITVLQNSSEMVRNDMTFWSSPVANQNVRNFSPETLVNRFWTYNESNDQFEQIFAAPNNLDPLNYNFENGKGVSIRVKNTLPTGQTFVHNGEFVGVPNNGLIEVNVQNQNQGYNLIGNPYASTIKIEELLNLNPDVNSLYFWTHNYPVGSAQYSDNYAAYTRAGSVLNPTLNNIQKGQGFIVQVNSNSTKVTFNNTLREGASTAFFRSQPSEKHRIWLSLNQNENKLSQTLVAYLDGATNDVDFQIDAKVLETSANSFYNVINEEAYAIQGRPFPFTTEDEVNLGFIASNAGEYQIKLEAKDGIFAQDQEVYLLDRTLNQTHKLNDGVYTFTSEAGTFNSRFAVVYVQKSLGTDNLTVNGGNVFIYTTSNGVNVESKKSEIASVQVFDIQGKIIFEQYNINSKFIDIKMNSKGVYVLNVTTVDGASLSKKIIK